DMKKRFNINLDDSAFTKERTPVCILLKKKKISSRLRTSATTKPAQSVTQPVSYAEYIVQSKSNAAAASRRDAASKLPRSDNAEVTCVRQSEPSTVFSSTEKYKTVQDLAKGPHVKTSEEAQEATTGQIEGSGQRSEPGTSFGPKPVGSGSSIIVSPRQRGNPILKFVRSVPWEFGDVVPDYVLGQTTCALFLSLRYHNLNPNYIHDRLKQLGHTFTLRVLLVQVDVVSKDALYQTLLVFLNVFCCRYLETYKSYEKKPADMLKEQVEKDYLSKVTDCLTTVKSINKTDAITLLSAFSSVEGIVSASKEDLVVCPGLGPQKARRLFDVLHKPFLKAKTKDS
uniref:DNA excision repair protein ERCC-1 n=1 Tax=Neolamprologus brichardi TaxID=32507 RepID=A0A3Q4HP56_NEOBR